MGRIDLHIHSIFSLDGEYTPAELALLCAKNHLSTIALTDHNSVKGVCEMTRKGKELGITVISGIELDCTCQGIDLHLLGYGIDIKDKRYQQIEQDILEQKRDTSKERIRILKEMGIVFDIKEVMQLARDGIVVGEMIAEVALREEKNRNNPLILPYLTGGDRSDNPYVNFFWDFCAQGKPAFCPISYSSFEQAADLIKDTGGFSVIAHPVNTVKQNEEMIRYMKGYGVEGIEVYSSYHSSKDIDYYKGIAKRYHLIETMGSDFHGKTKPAVLLGGTNGEEEKEILLQKLQNVIRSQ